MDTLEFVLRGVVLTTLIYPQIRHSHLLSTILSQRQLTLNTCRQVTKYDVKRFNEQKIENSRVPRSPSASWECSAHRRQPERSMSRQELDKMLIGGQAGKEWRRAVIDDFRTFFKI